MHDCKGRELKVGDRVLVPFTVTQIIATPDYCNLTIESVAGMPPSNAAKTSLAAINTKQTIRANEGDDVSFQVVHEAAGGTRIE